MILQRLAQIEKALNPPKVTRRTNPPRVAPTQPVNPPQRQVKTPAPTLPVNPPQPPVTTQTTTVGWGLWRQWMLANTVACFVWSVCVNLIGIDVHNVVQFALLGTLLGAMQWLVLRRLFSCKWWPLVTALGTALGWFLGYQTGYAIFSSWGLTGALIIGFVVCGVALGIMQWLILKLQVSRAEWWIIANAVGFIGISYSVYFTWSLAGIVLTTVACTFFSAITGGVLVWLMRQSAVKH
ncbi:hypothetical protein [Nostoc sp. UHCC 0870]|uniref:hypothetical protein n=1 Tax=Nostoc sp. UHCC 0870 TaxID=2914041 RepID=UPI001EDCFB5F|nr:hypothetical protein [Nostoc sp. UHCC 0870]UKO98665.1 hypothetical protein L6494_02710 [Nostoc sp. UHCC 0870]